MGRFRLSLAGLIAATSVFADEPRVAVTVYNHDLGLVRERRTIELAAGEIAYSFADVAARIDPTSVHLRAADGASLDVLEQNFEYDLLSSGKLMQRHVEKEVQIVLENEDVITGELLSYESGTAVVRRGNGTLTVVGGEQVVRVDLTGSADEFFTKPTLVWTLDNGRSGRRDVEVEYLTGGLSWHAEYVALANEKNTEVDLAGWVSVDNKSGAEYKDARLKLMAGDVHRATAPGRRHDMEGMVMAMAKAAPVEERSIFEYHLYEVQRPTTIRRNQVKQVSFVPNTRVPVRKEYLYEASRNDKIQVILEFENKKAHGLGIALPAGVVRVFQDDGRGGSEFIGEDRIDHTPRDEDVRLLVGHAFDIVGERKVMNDTRVSDRVRRQEVEIELRNRKDDDVRIKVSERLGGDWTIDTSSHPHEKEDAFTAEWVIAVPAGEEVMLRYTVTTRW